jgi:hypothetical protein
MAVADVTLEQARTLSGKDSIATIVTYMTKFPTDRQVLKLASRALLNHDGLQAVDSLEALVEWQNQAATEGAIEAAVAMLSVTLTDEDQDQDAKQARSVLFGRGGSLPTHVVYDVCKMLEPLIMENSANKARAVAAGVFEGLAEGMRATIKGDPDIIEMAAIMLIHLTEMSEPDGGVWDTLPKHRDRALAAGIIEVIDLIVAAGGSNVERVTLIKKFLQTTA